MYALLFRLVLRRLDAERAHHLGYLVIRMLGLGPLRAAIGRACRPDPSLAVEALGLRFPSPFGVAAGFDKAGHAVLGLGALGFGHVEVGTVTALAQPRNPRPRLFRLIQDRALINRMGFNNDGAQVVAARLARLHQRRHRPIIGVNIGKSRMVALDDAIGDYLRSTRALAPVADYLVVNVSSPNTPGLRELQDLNRLAPLLAAVREAAGATPVLVKIAPDLGDDEVRGIAALVVELRLAGVVATNTTSSRVGLETSRSIVDAAGDGGLSGPPVARRAVELLRLLRDELPAELAIVSVGGVETAADVRQRLESGAALVQGYTAFLYAGPLWARRLDRGLRGQRLTGGR
ncbi:MAG: quinone-dependent dihydroorotate dehydrogenase [Micrococcales bacterium]|nr:quinone-dependent dihydroorotate dehydrogenase [Micrococcales bacterium]